MGLSRRDILRLGAGGMCGVSASGWLDALARHASAAAPRGAKKKSCILLWMDGGPSHHDTFDPKPEAPAEYRGLYKAIATSADGIQISEQLPKTARQMHHAAVIRGMSTKDNNHGTARVLMHTGYRAGDGTRYPLLGSIVSSELGESDASLPSFVATGRARRPDVLDILADPGYLGPRHAPMVVRDPSKGLADGRSPLDREDFDARVTLVEELEKGFLRRGETGPAEAAAVTWRRAVQLMRSPAAKAFDIDTEPRASREAYGNHVFGQGCLLARRLIEAGVRFVEVYHSNWDTHDGYTSAGTSRLHSELDSGMSTLLADLATRGLLDTTLVVWMGEFGRTPKAAGRGGGRDHYSKAWSTLLAGGGIRGGQVIGKTDDKGAEVVDRPVDEADFMATVCSILGIDPAKEVETPGGRPIRLLRKDAKPIQGLL